MTVYSYSRVLVWDNLGGSVKVARNQRVDVTDPATGLVAAGLRVKGQPVSYVTSDGDGHVTFSSTMGLVRLTSQRGFWQDVESPDLRSGAVQAGLDAAAAAASAATSASSARTAASDAATQTLAGAQSRLDASASAAASSASAASDSATAARDSANLVGTPADTAIATAVNGAGTQTRTALDGRYPKKADLDVNVRDYGAVADWNGATGTNNTPAFTAALAATPEGGTLLVPAGRYYFAGPFVLNKSVHFSTGAGGFTGGPIGTQLVFAAGVSGIQVVNTGTVAPAKWTIGPFNIKSMSTAAGTDVGIFISAGRGSVEGATIEGFGSHGVHIKAGVGWGGNNANNTELHSVRSYSNRGDGILVEGTDANACLIVKPDVVSNYGWGINLERSSATKVTAPHADQRANSSPGAFRDNGTANDWDWVYVEGAGTFLIDVNSSHGRMTGSGYAPPTVTSNTSNSVTWRIEQDSGARNLSHFRELGTGKKLWRMIPGSLAAGSFDFIQQTDSLRVYSVDSSVTRVQWYADQRPATDASKSLGSSSLRWLNGFFSSFVRVGATTTAARPTAATAGAGGHMFDTTLNKPIWSDGTNWRDATGAVV